jgi:ADP-heptose:LPS heptosyltransferase
MNFEVMREKNNLIDSQSDPGIQCKPWKHSHLPGKILLIRLQAMGDVAITLPYVQHLRQTLPDSARLDYLTLKENAGIPEITGCFTRVYTIGGGRNYKKQLMATLSLLPALFAQRYDVIIDLQNNQLSKIVRQLLMPQAWSAFDRFSPVAAGERNRRTIEAAGLGINKAFYKIRINEALRLRAVDLLKKNGWDEQEELVVLNPAGAFITRNWEMVNYAKFAQLWLQHYPKTKFLVLGVAFMENKARALKELLGDNCINLVQKTTPTEAFAILQLTQLMLSEDSGLMHMAWVSGIPTLALFGGTRSDWARPLGKHSFFLDSSDLPCGNCMLETCRYGNVYCLSRYTPEMIFDYAQKLRQVESKAQC